MPFPGEVCKKSGVYRVTHREHRFCHDVLVQEGTVFPPCKVCGASVCFDEVSTLRGESQIVKITDHTDFREKERRKAQRA